MDTIPMKGEKLYKALRVQRDTVLTFNLVATVGRSHVNKSFARSSCQSVMEGINARFRAFNVNNSTNDDIRFRFVQQHPIVPHSTGQLVMQHDKSVYAERMLIVGKPAQCSRS